MYNVCKIGSKIGHFLGQKIGWKIEEKKHRFLGHFFTDRHADNLDNVEEININLVEKKLIM